METFDWPKLAKLVGMMSSSQSGEALNARDLVLAQLRKDGLSWSDLIKRIASAPPPPPRPPNGAAPWEGRGSEQHDFAHAASVVFDLQNRVKAMQEDMVISRQRANQVFWKQSEENNALRAQVVALEKMLAEKTRAIEELVAGGSTEVPQPPQPSDHPISELGLSTRLRLGLFNQGIGTLSQAAALTRAQILRIPNIGKRSYRELRALLIARGWWQPDAPD